MISFTVEFRRGHVALGSSSRKVVKERNRTGDNFVIISSFTQQAELAVFQNETMPVACDLRRLHGDISFYNINQVYLEELNTYLNPCPLPFGTFAYH